MKGRAQHERKYTKSCQAFEHCDHSVADGLSDSSETSFVAATGQLWVLGAQSAVSTVCPLWVKSGHSRSFARCPLYHQKQTLELSREMSAMCQKQTCAPQQSDRFRRAPTIEQTMPRGCGAVRA